MGKCPLCDNDYSSGNTKRRKSRHHIYPKYFYKNTHLVVNVCQECHSDFHHEFPSLLPYLWTRAKCLKKWVKFCESKGKDAYEIYPQLLTIKKFSNENKY